MVSLERKVCIITGELYETGALIMPKTIKPNVESPKYLTTGYGMSEPYQKLVDDGYVHLLEATGEGKNANRTGRIASVRRSVCCEMFGTDVKENVVYITPDDFGILVTMSEQAQDKEQEKDGKI